MVEVVITKGSFMTRLFFLLTLSIYLLSGCSSDTPDSPLEGIIVERQEKFESMGAAMKQIEDEFRKRRPDMHIVNDAASIILLTSDTMGEWFPVGTGPDSGFKTKTKATVWEDQDRFRKLQESFRREAQKLSKLATEGHSITAETAFHSLGMSCSNCHKTFREKD